MESTVRAGFYQNRCGEIFALVEDRRDKRSVYRFIENIERMRYSPEDVAEEAERGFDGFSEFDPYEHGGLSFGEVAFEITDSEEYRLIAEFCDNLSGFVPENMDERAKALFGPLMETVFNNPKSDPHEEQLCFFAA